MKWNHEVVRAAVARRAHCEPCDVRPWHHLEADLGLAPPDVAGAAAELEELAGIEIPAAALGSVATVGDLSWIFLESLRVHPRGGRVQPT
jgi:hypothetical protein